MNDCYIIMQICELFQYTIPSIFQVVNKLELEGKELKSQQFKH